MNDRATLDVAPRMAEVPMIEPDSCVAALRLSLRNTRGTPPSFQSAPGTPATSASKVSRRAEKPSSHSLTHNRLPVLARGYGASRAMVKYVEKGEEASHP